MPDPLKAISPIDGRYSNKTKALQDYASEFALMRERVLIEIEYFLALSKLDLPNFPAQSDDIAAALRALYQDFSLEDAQRIKYIESTTNHDVKAIEYFIKEKMSAIGLDDVREWVHFGLTSQDINNSAFPSMLNKALRDLIIPGLEELQNRLQTIATAWENIPMLAHTHGQPASPTTMGKEFKVFGERLQVQLDQVRAYQMTGKFGGATGNFNAHLVAFPDVDWPQFADKLLADIGLKRQHYTTQIEHYDQMAALFQLLARINTIQIDLCRDLWTYISMEYFLQKTIKDEVGSSAMPHKVNPIDFENAEGNLGVANAILGHLAAKLPISRLQRDLTDSTVLRNVGVPLGHMVIAGKSILKGLSKLLLNEERLKADLEKRWIITSEAIQTILRREGIRNPYEMLKDLTRGKTSVSQAEMHAFIATLPVSDSVKLELQRITPHNYIGYN